MAHWEDNEGHHLTFDMLGGFDINPIPDKVMKWCPICKKDKLFRKVIKKGVSQMK